MAELTVYLKPTCTTCRRAVSLLRQRGVPFQAVDLVRDTPTPAELAELCRELGVSPRQLLRRNESIYRELGLDSGGHADRELLEIMTAHPELIQRPIAVRGGRAVLGRPLENLEPLLAPEG